MSNRLKRCLIGQYETAWMLASYHLDGLTTEECLWRPASRGLHVAESSDGIWHADWPESEGYDIAPPSIGWLTWHMGFLVVDGARPLLRPGHPDSRRTSPSPVARRQPSFGSGTWPTNGAMRSVNCRMKRGSHPERTRWPMQGKPFSDVVAWASVELTKNASEIGYARFLHAVT